jgi:ABC-type sugar transport system substrate-binding protein
VPFGRFLGCRWQGPVFDKLDQTVEMKKVLPQYPSVNLVTVAYGDDLSDKSYREAVGLLKTYPDLKVIVSPSSVGIVAAAQAVKDQGKIGKVYVTGLGLPSEMAGAVKSGASKSWRTKLKSVCDAEGKATSISLKPQASSNCQN